MTSKDMIYVKVKMGYGGRTMPAKAKALIDNASLSICSWTETKDGQWELSYSGVMILPLKLVELLLGEVTILGSYTSEELASIYEDKIIFNHKTGAAVPNAGLWQVEEVRLEEDCCTDRLSDALEGGWHILAICPQAQRRPDYILGRGKDFPTKNTQAVQTIVEKGTLPENAADEFWKNRVSPPAPVDEDNTPF